MLPSRRYWARFMVALTAGATAGLLVGELITATGDVPGWGMLGAAIGFVVGLVLFMFRGDT